MPSALVLTCVTFLMLASLVALAISWMRRQPSTTPFAARPLLNDVELDFYKRLRHALPEYQVLPQVSLAALLRPVHAERGARTVRDRIARARVNYVIAARTDLSVLALVELDDQAPLDEPERERMAAAGYKTHRFSVTRNPSALAIREQLLGRPTAEIVLLPGPDSPERLMRS